jgi:hypothetical protein
VTEVYRKFGRVVRRENALIVRVDEAGEAIEDGGMFQCSPLDEQRTVPDVDADAVNETADAIAALVKPPLVLERAIVSEGVSLHEYGDTHWTARMRRVHLSIARPPHRALIDLGEFSLPRIVRICEALARVDGERPQQRIRLSESVGAALLPSLLGVLPMEQWPAPHDGKGAWIANVAVDDGAPPNWFRPSYRARPVRAWFHIRAEPKGVIDRRLPEAIALLAPIHDRTLRVLCVDGGIAFVTTVSAAHLTAVAPTSNWFPYAAGCFGAEMSM